MENVGSALVQGFTLWIALVATIGPQNALIIKQGLRRHAVGAVLAVCIVSDLFFIFGGTLGVGFVVDRMPWLLEILKWGGALYLVGYGLMSLRDAIRPKGMTRDEIESSDGPAGEAQLRYRDELNDNGTGGVALVEKPLQEKRRVRSLRGPVLAAIAMTWINPSAYLDGFVMLGSVANQYGEQKWFFALGALFATLVWFPAIGYGAQRLAGPLSQPKVWKWINLGIAAMMFFLAVKLLTTI